jgi:hypothetical protein
MSVIEAPPEKKTLLESWATNERMRHVPPVAWLVQKLDGDLRRRIGLLLAPLSSLAPDDSHRPAVDAALRAQSRALERVAEGARQGRGGGGNGHGPQDPASRVQWALEQAVASLRSVDGEVVGRRYPVQTFERSKAEPLYGALLTVIDSLDRLTALVRDLDPLIDERLYEPLVNLQQPLDPRPMA